MIFGGLEFVAGGYLIHRHYKHKNEKKRQEDEVEARRHNTFPGAKRPTNCYQQQHAQHQHYQQPIIAQQKYPCYGQPAAPRPQPQQQYSYPPPQPHAQARPPPPQHAPTFNIPRRPVPEHKPQILIQPSLQRADSFATLSRMPIADGRRPSNLPEEDVSPVLPPRRHATGGLQPATVHGIYGNTGYSVSTPALGATPTSPGLTYVIGANDQTLGGHSTDDNWETYGYHGNTGAHYAPTEASTQLGEHDPPPPYRP